VLDGKILDPAVFSQNILSWIKHYPIAFVKDLLTEDDTSTLAKFCASAPNYVQMIISSPMRRCSRPII